MAVNTNFVVCMYVIINRFTFCHKLGIDLKFEKNKNACKIIIGKVPTTKINKKYVYVVNIALKKIDSNKM